jgi:FHS family glucose/mannose:H+ symporter-like MFS transporter
VKLRLALIHFGFALTGVVTTMLGPFLPILSLKWHLNDAQAGRLFTAQFVSAVTGSLLGSRLLARKGAGWTVAVGMFLVGCGVSLVVSTISAVGIFGICLFGAGLGFVLPATNLLVAEIVPERKISALNLLNFSWTVGALAGPLLISFCRRTIGLQAFVILLAAALVIVAMVELVGLPTTAVGTSPFRTGKLVSGKRFWFAVLTTFFLIIYVGIENGFSGWLSALTLRLHQTTADTAALVQSSFWGAVLLGRLAAPLLVRFLSPDQLVFAGLTTAGIGIAATVSSNTVALLEVGVLLCGLGLAALFPTVVAIFAEWFGTGGAGSLVLGVCGLGGALVPALIGIVALRAQSLRLGFSIILSCILLAAITFWRMQFLVRSQST